MQHVDLILSFACGGLLGFFVGRLFFLSAYKSDIQEQVIIYRHQASIQTVNKIIKMLDGGIAKKKWPSLAHFRRDLVEIIRILENNFKN